MASAGLVCLLVLSAPAAPGWSIAVTRTIGLDLESGLQIAETLGHVMDGMQAPALGKMMSPRPFNIDLRLRGGDPSLCAGSLDCVAHIGELSGLRWLVSLSLARVGAKLVVDAALIDVEKKSAVVQLTETLPYADPQLGIGGIAQRFVAALPAAAPREPGVAAAPEPGPAEPVVEQQDVAGFRMPFAPVLIGGGGLLALALGVGFGMASSSASATFYGAERLADGTVTGLSQREARQLEAEHQRDAIIANVCFAAAGTLALTAVLTWILGRP